MPAAKVEPSVRVTERVGSVELVSLTPVMRMPAPKSGVSIMRKSPTAGTTAAGQLIVIVSLVWEVLLMTEAGAPREIR
ncbi:MAG: hypothetical protein RL376_493 [Verrucomicrobiota bacterium]